MESAACWCLRGFERAACACDFIDKQIYARILGRKRGESGAVTTGAALMAAWGDTRTISR